MLPSNHIERTLLPALQQFELERKSIAQTLQLKTVQTIIGIGVTVLFGIGIGTALFMYTTFAVLLPIICIVVGCIIILLRQYHRDQSEKLRQVFEAKVKREVYQQVFKAWKADCTYDPKDFIPRATFKQANLYTSFDDYKGDDYCTGRLKDGRVFHFSELLVRQQANFANNDPSSYQDVFKGLFFVLQGPHLLQGLSTPTLIIPRKQEAYQQKKKNKPPKSTSTNYGDNILDANFAVPAASKKEEKETKLFDQLYQIKSPTQWTVRRKLSTAFEEQLNQMRVNLRQQVSLSFQNDTIYLAIPHRFDFWVVNIKEPLTNPQRLNYLAWNFKVAFEVLDRLEKATTVA